MKFTVQEEFELFQANKDEWIKEHEGRFVLIKGKQVVGFFDDEQHAIDEGLKRFPNTAFFVDEVAEKDDIRFVPRIVRTA